MATTPEDLYLYYTQKAGDIGRQLAIAGIALIWLVHVGISGEASAFSTPLDPELRSAVVWIIWSVAFDAVQYLWGSIVWGYTYYKNEVYDINKAKFALWSPTVFVALKLIFVLVGYYKLYGASNVLNIVG